MKKQSRYEKEHQHDEEDEDRVNMGNEENYSPYFKREKQLVEEKMDEKPEYSANNYWKCDIYSEESVEDLLSDYQ